MSADSVERAFQEVLEAATSRLRSEGYDVEIQPAILVEGLGSHRPDYIARRGDEIIIGEVKFRGASELSSLQQVARMVESLPNAKLELNWLGKPDEEILREEVLQMASTAKELAEGEPTAALLLAWSALEGCLQLRVNKANSGKSRETSVRRTLSYMVSIGDLSDTQFERLIEASNLRNRIAHGKYLRPNTRLVEYVCETAIALARGEHRSIDGLVEWFLEHYEDPVEGVPYDSEDGYLYVNGGPFDAEDVLQAEFPDLPAEDIESAVSEIERVGYLWVHKGDY